VDLEVGQVRFCIEVLRRFLAPVQLSSGEQAFLEDKESRYRVDAYTTLLKKVGAAYDEMRLAVHADPDTRQRLADRLGIDPTNLDGLVHDLDPAQQFDMLASPPKITEAALERLFGLVDTRREPLSAGVKFGDTTAPQITHWEFRPAGGANDAPTRNGIEWGRNTDPDGNIYVTLDQSANVYRVQVFRHVNKTAPTLVAQGTCATAQGTVQLAE